MARRAALAAIMGAVVALSGCTGTDNGDNGAALAARMCGDKEHSADQVLQGIAIPKGFVPVAAMRCVFVAESGPAGAVRVEERATGDLTALVVALGQPNWYRSDALCTMVPRRAFVITLVNNAGDRVTPTPPTSPCGDSSAALRIAIQELSWVEVSRTPIAPASVRGPNPAAWCPTAIKTMVAMAAAGQDPPNGPASFPVGTDMMVCHYALYPVGGDLSEGRLDEVIELQGPPLQEFRAKVVAAPPVTGTCDRPQPNTALVYPWGSSPDHPVAVEVGGCFRVLDSGGVLRQLDATAVSLLTVALPWEWPLR